jgi:CheY-like chemotaxis protein
MLPMEEASVARGVARMPQERILIVEDEPDLRQVFVDILTSEGFDSSVVVKEKRTLSYAAFANPSSSLGLTEPKYECNRVLV